MLIKLKNFVSSFIQRGGHYIFFSTMTSKVMNFLLSVFIVRILSEHIYGNVSYAFSIIVVLLPISGLGLHHSLLRYGALEKNVQGKNRLFNYLFKWGFLFSVLIASVLFFGSGLISFRLPDSNIYIKLMSFLVITFFISEYTYSYLRIHKNNKMYSWGITIKSILVLAFCLTASILWSGTGYIASYVIVPLIVAGILLYFSNGKYSYLNETPGKYTLKKYLNYGIWIGLGSIASQLVIALDTIMVANIMADSVELAIYKVATIIPVNLIAIPMVLFRTDYVYIAENFNKRSFLISYYKKYLLSFSVILAIILLGWILFGNIIVSIFGPNYIESKPIISLLMVMVALSFIMRVPLGNIINAVGKSKWNSISNLVLLFLNIVLNAILIPRLGLKGAAIATNISVFVSGMFNLLLFRYYLKKYCLE